ncbi:MAG: hypothetical protein EPO64_02650 [Nitrospirae bacterium]|nr:MAG: hypothetical protein EPO64_02650 [Nitrospirota bacterium]
MMRVTEQQIFGIVLGNMQRLREKSLVTQDQISSQKRVTRPSDDPIPFGQIVTDKASLAATDQRLRNINFGTTRLDTADQTLGSVMTSLGRVKELAAQMRNDVNGLAQRQAGALELRQIFAQLRQMANTQVNGQALFTGTSTRGRATGVAITPPTTITGGSNDTLIVNVDGSTSGTITLTAGTYSTGSALATQVQTKINADATLTASGKSVTVTYDTDHLVITSNASGAASTVSVTGGTSLNALGFNGGSTTSGEAPFALQAATSADARNAGSALITQGNVSDPNTVTLDDYLVKFSAATTFDVFNASTPVTVTANAANTGGAVKGDSGVADPSKVTLDNYNVNFKNVYTVTTGTNDGIRFDPGTGAVTATLAAGAYTGSQLAVQIKAAMEAVSGGKTYTVSFNDTTGKFSITNDVANGTSLSLQYSNAASTAKSLLGSTGTDQAGIAAGGTATSDVDTTGLAGVSKQSNVYDTTLATNIFNITSSNNTLIVNDTAAGAGADTTITLATGSYTGAQLATELASKLNASRNGANTVAYTVAYGSVTSRRFTINDPALNANSLILKFGDIRSTAAQILGSTPVTVTETVGASATTLNSDSGNTTYQSGANIDFEGLRVVLQDGATGPRNGDVFAVAQTQKKVLSNQSYVSGSVLAVNGLQFSLRDGTAAPASGDLFRVQTGVQYQGNSGLQAIEVGNGQTVKTNLPGDQVFTGATINIFASIKNLVSALNGNYGGGIEQGNSGVDSSSAQVSNAQGEIGALSNQLSATSDSLGQFKDLVTKALSENEDTDLITAISEMTMQQQALQATMQTANQIFDMSLLKFLK